MLPNGNILFHDTWTTLKEITLDKKVVWEYDCANSNGNKGKRVHVHAFARLPNGNTRIVESGVGRVIEVDKDKTLKHQFALKPGGTTSSRWARATDKGTFLVCSERPGVVTEYDVKDGKVVWDYLINTRVYGAMRLRNGNTLIASGSGNSVVEVSPEKKVVWEIKGKVPGTEVNLKWMTCLQERDNGNFIVGTATPARTILKFSRSHATRRSSGNSTSSSSWATAWPAGKYSRESRPPWSARN